eukprot:6012108-Prorocentrum_lima.AAC.1
MGTRTCTGVLSNDERLCCCHTLPHGNELSLRKPLHFPRLTGTGTGTGLVDHLGQLLSGQLADLPRLNVFDAGEAW